jgi:hypothetical protein
MVAYLVHGRAVHAVRLGVWGMLATASVAIDIRVLSVMRHRRLQRDGYR